MDPEHTSLSFRYTIRSAKTIFPLINSFRHDKTIKVTYTLLRIDLTAAADLSLLWNFTVTSSSTVGIHNVNVLLL